MRRENSECLHFASVQVKHHLSSVDGALRTLFLSLAFSKNYSKNLTPRNSTFKIRLAMQFLMNRQKKIIQAAQFLIIKFLKKLSTLHAKYC